MLAKQLIGEFFICIFGRPFSRAPQIDELALSPPNTGSHFIVKIKGRKKVCVHSKKVGRKTVSGSGIETVSL